MFCISRSLCVDTLSLFCVERYLHAKAIPRQLSKEGPVPVLGEPTVDSGFTNNFRSVPQNTETPS